MITCKLLDGETRKVVGVICDGTDETSVALSLEKAEELGVEDIDIIEYLDVRTKDVYLHPIKKGFFAYDSSSVGFMDDYEDVPYERIGSLSNVLELKEVIYGNIFNFSSFIQLDNEEAIKRLV